MCHMVRVYSSFCGIYLFIYHVITNITILTSAAAAAAVVFHCMQALRMQLLHAARLPGAEGDWCHAILYLKFVPTDPSMYSGIRIT